MIAKTMNTIEVAPDDVFVRVAKPASESPTFKQPTTLRERISSIDVLRGFALLGILMMNIDDFGTPEAAHDIPIGMPKPAFVGPHAHLNLVILILKWVFFEGKMRAIFSMLFGAGVVLMTTRAEKRGAGGQIADIYLRRNMWLMLLGLLHGCVLWTGDILFLYALTALLVLYPLRKLKAKRAIRFSIPGIPMRTIPAVPSSKIDLICSRLFIWSRSASSTRIREVGSETARCLA
jgi:uncharacterized protein